MIAPLDFDGLIIDLDGVVWVGGEPVRGSVAALAELRARGVPMVFLTNDPTNTRAEYAARLHEIGVRAAEAEIVTAGSALATLISAAEAGDKAAYVIGSVGFQAELQAAGIHVRTEGDERPVDVVAVAGHTGFDYQELRIASRHVRRGAQLYAAGRDPTFPMPDGPWPATGAILAAVETAAGVRATVAGKPERHIFEIARSLLGRSRAVAVVGDTLDSDIAGGRRAGLATILVLTGTTSRDDLRDAVIDPDLVLDDLAALLDLGTSGGSSRDRRAPDPARLAVLDVPPSTPTGGGVSDPR